MPSAGSSLECSARKNRPRTNPSARISSSTHTTRGRPNSKDIPFPRSCAPATMRRSSAGDAPRPPTGPAVAARTCSTASRSRGSGVISLYAVSNVINLLEAESQRKNVPTLIPGDTVKVHAKVVEGTRERIQIFEGIVIGCRGSGAKEIFTVRRIAHGVGVERSFLLHSPRIEKIDVVRHGKVRRAKLYYLRGRVGKSARIREKRQAVATTAVPADISEADAGTETPES